MNKIKSHDDIHNEGGEGYNPHEAQDLIDARAKSEARIDELMGRAAEVRAAWNAAVAKYSVDGKVNMRDLPKIEAAAGASQLEMSALKARGAF